MVRLKIHVLLLCFTLQVSECSYTTEEIQFFNDFKIHEDRLVAKLLVGRDQGLSSNMRMMEWIWNSYLQGLQRQTNRRMPQTSIDQSEVRTQPYAVLDFHYVKSTGKPVKRRRRALMSKFGLAPIKKIRQTASSPSLISILQSFQKSTIFGIPVVKPLNKPIQNPRSGNLFMPISPKLKNDIFRLPTHSKNKHGNFHEGVSELPHSTTPRTKRGPLITLLSFPREKTLTEKVQANSKLSSSAISVSAFPKRKSTLPKITGFSQTAHRSSNNPSNLPNLHVSFNSINHNNIILNPVVMANINRAALLNNHVIPSTPPPFIRITPKSSIQQSDLSTTLIPQTVSPPKVKYIKLPNRMMIVSQIIANTAKHTVSTKEPPLILNMQTSSLPSATIQTTLIPSTFKIPSPKALPIRLQSRVTFLVHTKKTTNNAPQTNVQATLNSPNKKPSSKKIKPVNLPSRLMFIHDSSPRRTINEETQTNAQATLNSPHKKPVSLLSRIIFIHDPLINIISEAKQPEAQKNSFKLSKILIPKFTAISEPKPLSISISNYITTARDISNTSEKPIPIYPTTSGMQTTHRVKSSTTLSPISLQNFPQAKHHNIALQTGFENKLPVLPILYLPTNPRSRSADFNMTLPARPQVKLSGSFMSNSLLHMPNVALSKIGVPKVTPLPRIRTSTKMRPSSSQSKLPTFFLPLYPKKISYNMIARPDHKQPTIPSLPAFPDARDPKSILPNIPSVPLSRNNIQNLTKSVLATVPLSKPHIFSLPAFATVKLPKVIISSRPIPIIGHGPF